MDPKSKVLEEVLANILKPDVKVTREELSSFIEKIEQSETNQLTPYTKIYTKWIQTALSEWTYDQPIEVAEFIVKLCGVLCKNDIKFLHLLKTKALDSLISVLHLNNTNLETSLKLPFMQLLRVCLKYKFGVDWVITTHHHWKHVYEHVYKGPDNYACVKEQLPYFMIDLFYHVVEVNRLFLVNIVQVNVENLVKMSDQLVSKSLTEEEEKQWLPKLKPVLDNFEDMTTYFIEKTTDKAMYKLIVKYDRVFNCQERLITILKAVKCKELTFLASRGLLCTYYFDICISADSNLNIGVEPFNELIKKILFVQQVNVDRGFLDNVLDLSYCECAYRKNKFLPVTIKDSNSDSEAMQFEMQFIVFPLAPIIFWDELLCKREFLKLINDDEHRDDFFYDFFKGMFPEILRFGYYCRDVVLKQGNLAEHSIYCLELLQKNLHEFPRKMAIMMFRTLVYVASDFIQHAVSGDVINQKNVYKCTKLGLDCLVKFIKHLNITWRDSIESIEIMNICSKVFNLPNVPTEAVAASLRLLALSISKYMSPNLALLVETNDSTMHYIGTLLYSKLRDSDYEVRRAAHDVLLSISENAETKFPYFRKILMESHLPGLALNSYLLINEDCSIRKIAVNCLKHLVAIPEISEEAIDLNKLSISLLGILCNPEQKIIYGETLSLIKIILELDFWTERQIEPLYEILFTFITSDIDDDIKLEALHLTSGVIFWHLKQEGYIDNEFPETIFVNKKIKILNRGEIKKRLIRVMHKFGDIGCLNILLYCKRSEQKSNLYQKGTEIINHILKLLSRYQINSETIQHSSLTNLDKIINECLEVMKMDHLGSFTEAENVRRMAVNPIDFLQEIIKLERRKIEKPDSFLLYLNEFSNHLCNKA